MTKEQEFITKYLALCNEYGFYGVDGGCSCCGDGLTIYAFDTSKQRLVLEADSVYLDGSVKEGRPDYFELVGIKR